MLCHKCLKEQQGNHKMKNLPIYPLPCMQGRLQDKSPQLECSSKATPWKEPDLKGEKETNQPVSMKLSCKVK